MQKQTKRKIKEWAVYLIPIASFIASVLLKFALLIYAPICLLGAIVLHYLITHNDKASEKAISDQLTAFMGVADFPKDADIRCTLWVPIKGDRVKQAVHYLPAGKVHKGRVMGSRKGVVGEAMRTRVTQCLVLTEPQYSNPAEFRRIAQKDWGFTEEETLKLDGTRKSYVAIPILGDADGDNEQDVLAVIYCDSNRTETFQDEAAVKELAGKMVPFFKHLFN